MDGWIKLHRKSLESSVFHSPIIWAVWCWCLVKASHKSQKFPFNEQDIIIKEGQFITGRFVGSTECHISEQQWRTAIGYLKSTNRITSKSNNKHTVITILKWEEYQTTNQRATSTFLGSPPEKEGGGSKINQQSNQEILASVSPESAYTNQQSNQPVTNEQPTSNQPVTTYKNDKNVKNDKNRIDTSEQARQIVQVFDIFKTNNPLLDYGNKTERKAAAELIKQFGLEETLKMATYAVSIQGQKYAPLITTPYQLKVKYTQLAIYEKKH